MQKTMWMLGIVSCIMVSCRESAGNEYETLNKMAAEEYRTPLRPGYEGRNPYWNVYAKRFLYAPAFDFQEKDGAREYLFRISSDDGRREWTFTADAPWRPLSPVWDSVAVGNVSLTVLAIGQDGEVLDTAGTRRFFRDYPFHAPYNGPAVPYRESALKAALYIHSLPFVQRFATETEPDLASYPHFSCACKVIGSLISNECLIARELPSRRDEALAIALGAANFLLSISQPDNAPLAHFPPTYYKGELQEKDEHRGKTITVEAAKGVGPAFLDLYELTGDRKWLLRAIGIARTYQRLQRSDGSFPIKMDFDTGQPVNDAPAMLHPLLNFLSRLHRQYGINEFLPMQEAGERWMREVPLKSFDMEGQFEDVSVMGLQPYENLTNCTAAPYADYLLRKEDPTAEDISNVATNYTRFICISKDLQIYPDASKMTLLMSLAHHPGALSGVLAKFASIGVNLSKLESRPVPGSDFEFRFTLDIEASPRDPRVVKLLDGLASDPEVEHFTYLGAYDEK